MAGTIRVGIGGWTFEPWRGTFYPKGLAQKRELEYASRQLTSIEINGTFYGSQKPESFARWREETPDGFVFSLKGPRFATNRRVLAEAGESVERFIRSGVLELGDKLGPVNWQLHANKRFDPADFEEFLKLLPQEAGGRPLRHVVEARHESFRTGEFVDLMRRYRIGTVIADKQGYLQIADVTAPFVYLRLQGASEDEEDGYAEDELDAWARRTALWARGGTPEDLAAVGPPEPDPPSERDVFVYMINGFKPKAPAAATALIGKLEAAAGR